MKKYLNTGVSPIIMPIIIARMDLEKNIKKRVIIIEKPRSENIPQDQDAMDPNTPIFIIWFKKIRIAPRLTIWIIDSLVGSSLKLLFSNDRVREIPGIIINIGNPII